MRKLAANQQGMASFLITLIMMLVISLIVLGFAQLTRHNAREALDRQLSDQAYYAAESGVNVTIKKIQSLNVLNLHAKTACGGDYVGNNDTSHSHPDLGPGVNYTCVLVDPNPPSIVVDASPSSSAVVALANSGGISSLTFSWTPSQSSNKGTNCNSSATNSHQFPTASAWPCAFGLMRIDLVADPAGALAAANQSDGLALHTRTLFLTPLGGGNGISTVDYDNFGTPTQTMYPRGAACSGSTCTATVNLTGDGGATQFYARITSLYNDGQLTINGANASGSVSFTGGQAVVDVTGQAQDTLRRVQVRVPLTATADGATIPLNAITSNQPVCKHFIIQPSRPGNDPGTTCQPE